MFLAQISLALQQETVPDADGKESTRIVMKLNPAIAPTKCAVLPLLKNREELVKAAKDVTAKLKPHMNVQYDEKDAIGRRYRRQDAVGTPYCVTVDFDTLEDNTVTIRDRDSLEQQRVKIDDVAKIVGEKVDMAALF